MTKQCHHEFEKKPDYPEDTICLKCQTIWRIPDYLNWTPKQLMTLKKNLSNYSIKGLTKLTTTDIIKI